MESSQTRYWTHVSVLTGRFLSTIPPGKSQLLSFKKIVSVVLSVFLWCILTAYFILATFSSSNVLSIYSSTYHIYIPAFFWFCWYFIPAWFKLMITYGFYFFKNVLVLLAYFILLLSQIAVLMSDLLSYLPFLPPTVSGRVGGLKSLQGELLNAWFTHVESVTGSWPFYLLNILNPSFRSSCHY